MRQYFENRETLKLCNLDQATGETLNKIFANERPDKKFNKNNITIKYCTFANMGFRESSLKTVNLSFCVFIDCYFKQAKFDDVDFTGCIFINCNFEQAMFIRCDLRYTKYENCFIKYDIIKNDFPIENNIRRNLCRDMSIECLHKGEIDEYRKYFFEERRASEKYYFKILVHKNDDDYYKKYNWVDGLKSLGDYTLSKLNKYLWGYGEKLSRLINNIIIVILFFTIVYWNQCTTLLTSGNKTARSFWDCLYISSCNFFTISSNYISTDPFMRFITTGEGVVGMVLMGFFVAALFRYINRRG